MLRTPFFIFYGLRYFTKSGYEKASKSFDFSVTERDLTGTAALVSGGNQGLGYQVCHDLASRGATVYMLARNKERGMAAVEKIKQETRNSKVLLRVCDVASLADVKSLGEEFTSNGEPLNILVNNAGVLLHDNTLKSRDGYEVNFATNTLGSYALTRALEPVLKRTSIETNTPSRVIFVSSGGALVQDLVMDDLEGTQIKKDFGIVQYSRDKRRQIAMAESLSREWANSDDGSKVVAVTMHPGWTETEGVKKSIPTFYDRMKSGFRSLSEGADTILWLCCEDIDKIHPGGFYLDRTVHRKHLPLVDKGYPPQKADELLKILDTYLNPK